MSKDHTLEKLTPEATIRQIVSTNNEAGKLLASIGLSPKSHGDETLRSVCQQLQWSEAEVLKWVKKHSSKNDEAVLENDAEAIPGKSFSLKAWTEYLEKTYILSNLTLLGELEESFPRIHKIHGNQYPRLKYTEEYFSTFKEVLTFYYEFEKEKFFPLVDRLANFQKGSVNHGTIRKLKKSFGVLEKDRNRLKDLMTTIRKKAKKFQNPGLACSTLRIQNENFKTLFEKLEEQFQVEREQFIIRVKEEIEAKK